MSYLLGRIVGCFLLLSTNYVLAAPEFKPGFVNFESAFAAELEAQKYVKELEAQENSIGADEQKARIDIENKMAKFKTSVAKLSDAARAAEEAKLSAEIGDLQQKFADRRTKLANERSAKVSELENKNRLLVESISRKGAYSMVFNSATVVYVSDEIKKNDLTQELVAQYNKAYPVKPAAAKPAPKAPATKK
jgi:Skp family chaperone for outer membrane proteins